jgi:hypothetical protein
MKTIKGTDSISNVMPGKYILLQRTTDSAHESAKISNSREDLFQASFPKSICTGENVYLLETLWWDRNECVSKYTVRLLAIEFHFLRLPGFMWEANVWNVNSSNLVCPRGVWEEGNVWMLWGSGGIWEWQDHELKRHDVECWSICSSLSLYSNKSRVPVPTLTPNFTAS